MSRIAETFARLRAEGRPGLVTFTTAGDPDLPRSAEILKALARAGADVLEVGVPFSDPLADGPVIQRPLDLVAEVRREVSTPIVIFSYANPIVRMGLDGFVDRAADAGVDGVLALDLPLEEADEFRAAMDRRSLDNIFLLSPTTTDARIRKAAELGRGFLYGISRLGVTGARATVATGAEDMVRRIRAFTTLPLALGFGISQPEHVAEVGRYADAAVVGSALVALIAEASSGPDLIARVDAYVRSLRAACVPQQA